MAPETTAHQPQANPYNTVFDWSCLASEHLLAETDAWRAVIRDPALLANYYAPARVPERQSVLDRLLVRHAREFGPGEVAILRVPGRIHTLGVHVDRPGCRGPVNRLAVEREMLMVIGRRPDSRVVIRAQAQFPEFDGEVELLELYRHLPKLQPQYASLSNEASSWDQVARRIEDMMKYRYAGRLIPKSPRTFLAGAAFLLNDYFADAAGNGHPQVILDRGFNVVMESDVPLAAGSASSSATTIGFAMAICLVNQVRIPRENGDRARREIGFLEWLRRVGFSEWCAGTRGAEADHFSIIFGRAGGVSHIGPEGLRAVLRLPEGCAYILMNTPQRPKISDGYSKQRIESYLLGLAWLRAIGRKGGDRTLQDIATLADIVERIGLSDARILEQMLRIPDSVARSEIYASVDAGLLDGSEVEKIIGPRDGLSGYERDVPGAERDRWHPRRTALEQIADVKRSVRNREVLENPKLTDEEKRRAILRMVRTYQECMRVTDYGANTAVWNRGVSDDALRQALANLEQRPHREECALENLASVASYGMNSSDIDDLTQRLYETAGERRDDVGVITLGMGGGGSVLVMAAEDLAQALRDAYGRFADERGYGASSVNATLCIDVRPARGAEALIAPRPAP